MANVFSYNYDMLYIRCTVAPYTVKPPSTSMSELMDSSLTPNGAEENVIGIKFYCEHPASKHPRLFYLIDREGVTSRRMQVNQVFSFWPDHRLNF